MSQGSVLGPLLFTLYTTPISCLLQDLSLSFHLYAEDTQLYISFSSQSQSSSSCRLSHHVISDVTALTSCHTLNAVHTWLTANHLIVNTSKTEYLLVGTKCQPSKLLSTSVTFIDTSLSPTASVRNLGVTYDENLSLTKHISAVCSSSYHVIRLIRQIHSSLDHNRAVILCNALLSSKLDLCNTLCFNLSTSSIHRLQLVQNSLARVICPTITRCDHISPTLLKLAAHQCTH